MEKQIKKTCKPTFNISTQFVPTHFFGRYAQWQYHVSVGVEDADIQFDFPFLNLGAGVINLARCQQAEEFLKNSKAEWFVNIDVDEVWGKNAISDLINTGGDIISAAVHAKQYPHTPNFYYWNEEESLFKDWTGIIPDKPFEVDAVGFGFIAVRREVMLALWNIHNAKLFDSPKNNKWNNIKMGEDVAFCYKAGELGYKIVVNPNITVNHLSYVEIGRDDYNRNILQ